MAHRLFESSLHGSNYSKFRPAYPKELYEQIIHFMKEQVSSTFGLAVDIGCGSGQSTRPLAKHFNKVIGLDISPIQVELACTSEQLSNVEYRVGSERDIPVASQSVDLVSSGQAAHWFDPIHKFYEESDRVLRPNGCIVLYGYDIPTVRNNPNGDKLQGILSGFRKSMWDGAYWHERVRLLENRFSTFQLPYTHCKRWDVETNLDMSLTQFMGYIETWTAHQKYKQENPDSDILTPLMHRFHRTLATGVAPDLSTMKVTWSIFTLIGKKEDSRRI